MSPNFADVAAWLQQVSAQERKQRDLGTEVRAASKKWEDVLQLVHDHVASAPAIRYGSDGLGRFLDQDSSSSAYSNLKTTLGFSDSRNELEDNPFHSPFDDPLDEPYSIESEHKEQAVPKLYSTSSQQNEEDDEEFGEFVCTSITSRATFFPLSYYSLERPVYTPIEDQEIEALLPGEDLAEPSVVEGEGLVQPVQSRFDYATRRVRRSGNLALRMIDFTREKVEKTARRTYSAYVGYTDHWQHVGGGDHSREESRPEIAKRKTKEQQRESRHLADSSTNLITRPAQSTRTLKQTLWREVQACKLNDEVENAMRAEIESWRELVDRDALDASTLDGVCRLS